MESESRYLSMMLMFPAHQFLITNLEKHDSDIKFFDTLLWVPLGHLDSNKELYWTLLYSATSVFDVGFLKLSTLYLPQV